MIFSFLVRRPLCCSLLWTTLTLYLAARVCQLYADKLPTLLIVILHVVPPAVFAIVHGNLLYRAKGIVIFTVCCLGIGTLAESAGLRTGFPFGHYYFTSVMGPKVFDLPILLVLAYLGIGYCSWILSLVIIGSPDKSLSGARVLAVPLLASFVMLAWDLSMEPDWSTIDKGWIWRDGGAFYGVPASNFLGWYLTSYVTYQLFALYQRGKHVIVRSRTCWRLPIMLYGICGFGNLLIPLKPMAPYFVIDASGRQWMTNEILRTCALLSLFVMCSLALLAWLRVTRNHSETDVRAPHSASSPAADRP